MNQISIDFTVPYQRHSSTSRAAAQRIEPKLGTKRAIVLAFLRNGPATDEEMQRGIPMNPNTQRPRRVELVAARLIRDSGKTRSTAGGDQAVVWEIAETDAGCYFADAGSRDRQDLARLAA